MKGTGIKMAPAGNPSLELLGEPFDFWPQPAVISENNFKYKSLSNWAFNLSVGCSHACRFCYVPSASANKQAPGLKKYGVNDPDAEWGEYSLLRPWDEKKFLSSLAAAENTPIETLKADGNRAVIFCSTTDAYQTFHASTPKKRNLLNESARALVRKALEAIHDHSKLNVRILTRSPLVKRDFDLFKTFGNRLVFGMSLPTLNDKLSKIYEPKAPGPRKRLETLQAAKAAGLHVYVAMAPTYPECDEADLRATLTAIKELDPITVFHEPINIRAENVERIKQHAASLVPPVTLKTEKLQPLCAWRCYALDSLRLVENLADEAGLGHCLHLWPDEDLKYPGPYLEMIESGRSNQHLTKYEKARWREQDLKNYQANYLPWLEGWWSRISEWPGYESGRRVVAT